MDNLALNLAQFIKEKSGVSRLTLTDFRNYAHLRINAKLAPIIITGENGTGKTNILEAISFLTPGRGMRSARLADIKRITPALINDEYSPTEISNLNWAVSAQVCKGDEEIEYKTIKVITNGGQCVMESALTERHVRIDLKRNHWYRAELWGTVNGVAKPLAITSPVYTD
mgnify:CR=1 FL=1